MRKSIYFIAPVIALILLGGCAKERDNYDKYLTDGTWTLSTMSSTEKKVEQKNYVAAATPDQTLTDETTNSTSGGKETKVELNQTTLTPGSTTFNRTTTISNHSLTLSFSKEGKVTYVDTKQVLSTQFDTHIANGPVVPSSASPETTNYTIPWNWGNATETKQLLNLYSLGIFEVQIKKDQLILTRATNSKEAHNDSDGLGDFAYTSDENNAQTLTFTK
jgi:hypothetical protein